MTPENLRLYFRMDINNEYVGFYSSFFLLSFYLVSPFPFPFPFPFHFTSLTHSRLSKPSNLSLYSIRLPPSNSLSIHHATQLSNTYFTINQDNSVNAYTRDFLLRRHQDPSLNNNDNPSANPQGNGIPQSRYGYPNSNSAFYPQSGPLSSSSSSSTGYSGYSIVSGWESPSFVEVCREVKEAGVYVVGVVEVQTTAPLQLRERLTKDRRWRDVQRTGASEQLVRRMNK